MLQVSPKRGQGEPKLPPREAQEGPEMRMCTPNGSQETPKDPKDGLSCATMIWCEPLVLQSWPKITQLDPA